MYVQLVEAERLANIALVFLEKGAAIIVVLQAEPLPCDLWSLVHHSEERDRFALHTEMGL